MTSGARIILTADRSLMASYDVLLDAMTAASQTTTIPWSVMRAMLIKPSPHSGGQSMYAPLGLRRVEAALRQSGIPADEIVVVDEAHLASVINSETRLIAVSSGEPLGLGMSSSTMTSVTGGKIWPQVLLESLMQKIRTLRTRAPQARVLLGGPGAWQLAEDADVGARLGVDHVMTGYSEGNVAQVVSRLLAGEGSEMPYHIQGLGVPTVDIPATYGASSMGVVELSRGCGLGCEFCTLSKVPMGDLPVETILADAEMNLATGRKNIAALSEDFFRFGGNGIHCHPPAAIEILTKLNELKGLSLIQLDHCNVSSIAQYSDAELEEVARLLRPTGQGLPWLNIGVESPSGRLLRENGGAAKMAGQRDEDWGEFCALQLRRLCKAGFAPMVSLLLAPPGETDDDLKMSLNWVRQFGNLPLTIFPVLFAPIHDTGKVQSPQLRKLHWNLWQVCYDRNFKWVPRLYWNDQLASGVGAPRRLALQMMGVGQVAMWKFLLTWGYRRAVG